MKVLIVFNHPAPYKVRLFNELAKSIDLFVIFERKKAKDRPDAFYANNKYDFNHMFLTKGEFGNENSNTCELTKYLKQHVKEYDLIVMNGYSKITEMRAINYLNRKHIPFILFINGGIAKRENLIKRLIKKSYISSAQKYISPCEEADEYLKFYGAKKEDIYHYPYSTFYSNEILKKPLSFEEKMEIRKKWNLPEGKIIVCAGQFIPRKNNIQLLEAFKSREEKLLLIGEGPEENLYREYIDKNQLSNVIIHSFLKKDELFEVYRCCDAFITLSKEDIFGHTTVEAMANGLPVISSNKVISSLSLIQNGINGYVVELENNEIGKAISLVNSSMADSAIATSRNNCIEATSEHIISIFQELCK